MRDEQLGGMLTAVHEDLTARLPESFPKALLSIGLEEGSHEEVVPRSYAQHSALLW
jgi:hypothetical protein